MARLTEEVLNQMSTDVSQAATNMSLDTVIAADKEARARVMALQPNKDDLEWM